MSKLARRNQARQLRVHHQEKRLNESGIFRGKDGSAKHIAVVPLSISVDTQRAIKQLNDSVEVTQQSAPNGAVHVHIERFKRNLLYITASMELLNSLDVCRLADWVLLVMSVDQELGQTEDVLLRAIEGQGITNVVVVVNGMDHTAPVTKRSKVLGLLRAQIARYFPTIDKIFALDSKPDCANLVRSLCTAATRGIRWRDQRSWLFVEDVQWTESIQMTEEPSFTVALTGVVRGRGLNPDRLVHVPGWGDLQVGRISEVPSLGNKRKANELSMEEVPKEYFPSADRDDLATLAPEEVDMRGTASSMGAADQRGVLLDDHHYFSDDDSHVPPTPKKLPKGTSAYQAAWYLDDVSDSESDIVDNGNADGDLNMETTTVAQAGDASIVGVIGDDGMTNAGVSEYPESEMHLDQSPDDEIQQIADFRASRKKDAEEDLAFPDEIELLPHVLARERLAKYRGLKSLRTSEWNTEEDAAYEPSHYQRLLRIADYRKSRNAAFREASVGGAPPGMKVMVELIDVPLSLRSGPSPSSLFSLLRHEHKHIVINLNMTLHSALTHPVKSKEELIVQVGPRRFVIHPVFSAADTTSNDVHKYDRFLHPGRTAIATYTGPLTWGSVPVLVFQRRTASEGVAPLLIGKVSSDDKPLDATGLQLIASATTVPPSHGRVIAKRVILTGHPYKIHKKLVTMRYMFFNKEDVAWFSALPLWTKRGRQGFIKESLGTHGYFKATFDAKINPMDAVAVSLYRRVWPRGAEDWKIV